MEAGIENTGKYGNGLSRLSSRSEDQILEGSNLKRFKFEELKKATKNFSMDTVLGEGGFGLVFKGWLHEHALTPVRPGTGLAIAVKKLKEDGVQGQKEWLAEINYLGQLTHPNLVKLVGFCSEDDHRLLVYECMPKGSMESHLFRRGSYLHPLPWTTRMKVCLGAARALAFLHDGQTKVIYRDFKTSNILLDSEYNAKLSDFGLALGWNVDDCSHVSTCKVMGTYGYAAPEYLLKDRRLEGRFSLRQAQKVASLAFECLNEDPRQRPSMHRVVTALEQIQQLKN
ncbi:unnamed protein product [Thlaspi arvense]|uniref:non-specific serine/threonine protein kinase n=1 Tax=Thlaspi arvense TaxID=13288 RepID=A0AAU9RHQ1_THLAR|nr:unnamed protein product [Thlaspi arvense]